MSYKKLQNKHITSQGESSYTEANVCKLKKKTFKCITDELADKKTEESSILSGVVKLASKTKKKKAKKSFSQEDLRSDPLGKISRPDSMEIEKQSRKKIKEGKHRNSDVLSHFDVISNDEKSEKKRKQKHLTAADVEQIPPDSKKSDVRQKSRKTKHTLEMESLESQIEQKKAKLDEGFSKKQKETLFGEVDQCPDEKYTAEYEDRQSHKRKKTKHGAKSSKITSEIGFDNENMSRGQSEAQVPNKRKKQEAKGTTEGDELAMVSDSGDNNDTEKSDKKVTKKKKDKKKKKEKKVEDSSESVPAGSARTNCLEYLRLWDKDRDHWRFQKVRQVWLLNPKHMYDKTQIADEVFSTLLNYMEGLKGNAREITLAHAQKIIDADEVKEGTDEDSLCPNVKQDRARQVIQLLS